jgi:DNA-binding NarL/FixJ family response regulator
MSGFTESDRLILQETVPHLRRSLQLGAMLEHDRMTAAAQAAALAPEHSNLGMIVCDGNAQVRMVNDAGEAFCRAHGLRLGGTHKQLDMVRLDKRADLYRLIAATASGGPGGKVSFRTNLAAAKIEVCRLPGTLASAYAPPSAPGNFLVLLLVRAACTRMPPASELRRIFGLTSAEATVALSLASGTSGKEVAAQRGVSVTTVRAQVRSILQKAGARNLRDLAGLVASLAQ